MSTPSDTDVSDLSIFFLNLISDLSPITFSLCECHLERDAHRAIVGLSERDRLLLRCKNVN